MSTTNPIAVAGIASAKVEIQADAIRKAARRSKEWIVDNLGKDAFEGFKVGLESIVKANAEKMEGGGE